MELKEVQRHWDAFGKTDPLWAIVTRPDKRHGKWKPDEFFACGEEEIDRIVRHVHAISVPLRRRRALDFGCGAGRLTQALSRYFDQCDGIDIAPSMIELARKYDRPWQRCKYEFLRLWRNWLSGRLGLADSWPGIARLLTGRKCRYAVNDASDLALFRDDTFDLVYSSLVLQHMKPEYSLQYISEFLRVIAPGGLIIFQIPSRPMPQHELPYKASLRVPDTSFMAKPGQLITFPVRVKNLSDLTWPDLNLGNHWLSETGKLVLWDDGRAHLPAGMKPLEEAEILITVTVPKRPGRYRLEFDVVQESVLWFQAMGSETAQMVCAVQGNSRSLRAACRVLLQGIRATPGYRAGPQLCRRLLRGVHRAANGQPRDNSATVPPGDSPNSFEPIMETYGVPRDVLVKWIETHGGRIVDIQKDISVGKDWESCRYYVTKA